MGDVGEDKTRRSCAALRGFEATVDSTSIAIFPEVLCALFIYYYI